MYPTFYTPGGVNIGLVGYTDFDTANISTPFTVVYPDGALAGDFAIIVFNTASGVEGSIDLTGLPYWVRMYGDYSKFASNQHVSSWTVNQMYAGPLPAGSSLDIVPTTTGKHCGSLIVFRNVPIRDPIGFIYPYLIDTGYVRFLDVAITARTCLMAHSHKFSGKHRDFIAMTIASANIADPTPVGVDVEISHRPVNAADDDELRWIVTAQKRDSNFVNLFGYGQNHFSSWDTVNATVNDALAVGEFVASDIEHVPTGSDSPSYVSKTVDLVEGQVYTLGLLQYRGAATAEVYVRIIGPTYDTGYGLESYGAGSTGSVRAVYGDTPPQGTICIEQPSGVTGTSQRRRVNIIFTARESGPHEFRIGQQFDALGAGNYLVTASSTSSFQLYYAYLIEGFSTHEPTLEWLQSNGGTLENRGGDVFYDYNNTFRATGYRLTLGASDTQYPSKLSDYGQQMYRVNAEGIASEFPIGPSSGDYAWFHVSKLMYPDNAFSPSIPTKQYFEFEVDRFDAAVTYWTVGLVHWGWRSDATGGSTTAGMNTSGAYAYRSDGYIVDNGVTDAGGHDTANTVGDTIGVAVDRTAQTVQFYVNGVAQGSPLDISAPLDWGPMWILMSPHNSTTGTGIRQEIRLNTTGPFEGRKPSGYSAFDWTMEVA